MHDGNRHPGRRNRCACGDGARSIERRRLARHDHERARGAAPAGARGTDRSATVGPVHLRRIRADEHDVGRARHRAMLEGIVEHRDVRTSCRRALDRLETVGIDNHRDRRCKASVHERLIVAVAAHDDRGTRTARLQLHREPGGHRSLSRTPHGEIADAQRWYARRAYGKEMAIVHRIARTNYCAEQRGRREQQRSHEARAGARIYQSHSMRVCQPSIRGRQRAHERLKARRLIGRSAQRRCAYEDRLAHIDREPRERLGNDEAIPAPQPPRPIGDCAQEHDRRARPLRRDQRARREALGRATRSVGRDCDMRSGFHLTRKGEQRAFGATPRGAANGPIADRFGGASRDLAIPVLADSTTMPRSRKFHMWQSSSQCQRQKITG